MSESEAIRRTGVRWMKFNAVGAGGILVHWRSGRAEIGIATGLPVRDSPGGRSGNPSQLPVA